MKKGNYENEHDRNLANFDVLIAKLINLGSKYKPIRTAIHISALKIISQNAKSALNNVTELQARYDVVFKERERFFAQQTYLMRKIKAYILQCSAMTELELYLVSGCRKMPLHKLEKNLRHDYLLKNWSKLLHLIKVLTYYNPPTADMEIPYLENFYKDWYTKHQELKSVEAYLRQAFTIREEIFYRNRYGLVAIAAIVRTYIKYQFGWNSAIYRSIISLPIKNTQWEKQESSKVAEIL